MANAANDDFVMEAAEVDGPWNANGPLPPSSAWVKFPKEKNQACHSCILQLSSGNDSHALHVRGIASCMQRWPPLANCHFVTAAPVQSL